MKKVIYIFFVFLLIIQVQAYALDDFELGLTSYKDKIYTLSLKYFKKYLQDSSVLDIEKKLIALYYISKIQIVMNMHSEANQGLDIILQRKDILIKNGLYDSVIIMKSECLAYLSSIKESFLYLDNNIQSDREKDNWEIKLEILRNLAEDKNDNAIDSVIATYSGRIEKRTEAMLFLIKTESLLNRKSYHEASSILSEKLEKEYDIIIKSDPIVGALFYFLKGESLYYLDDYSQALIYYQKSLDKTSHGTSYYCMLIYKIGLSFWKLKDYDQSLKYFNEFISEGGEQKTARNVLGVMAQVLIELKEYDKARNYLLKYLSTDVYSNDYYKAMYWLGETYYGQSRYEEAQKTYEQLTSSKEEYIRSLGLYGSAWAYYDSHQYAQAEKSFERLLKIGVPEDVNLNSQLALSNIYYFRAEYDKSISLLKSILGNFKNVEKDRILFKLADIYFSSGDFLSAEQVLSTIVKNSQRFSVIESAMFKMAKAAFYQGKYMESITTLKKLIERFPKSGVLYNAYLLMGHSYYNIADYKKSVDAYRFVAVKSEDEYSRARALYYSGWSYYFMQDHSKAIKIFKDVAKRYPDSSLCPEVLFWLGEYYFNERIYEPAYEMFNELSDTYPNSSLADDAILMSAKAKEKQEDFEKALSVADKLVSTYSQSDLIPEAELEISSILYRKKDYEKSLKTLDNLNIKNPNSGIIQDAMVLKALCLKSLGSYKESLLLFDDIIKRSNIENIPVDPAWILEKARLHVLLGQNEDALEVLMKIIYGDYGDKALQDSILLAKDILVSDGHYDEAVILLQKLLKTEKADKTSIKKEISILRIKKERTIKNDI